MSYRKRERESVPLSRYEPDDASSESEDERMAEYDPEVTSVTKIRRKDVAGPATGISDWDAGDTYAMQTIVTAPEFAEDFDDDVDEDLTGLSLKDVSGSVSRLASIGAALDLASTVQYYGVKDLVLRRKEVIRKTLRISMDEYTNKLFTSIREDVNLGAGACNAVVGVSMLCFEFDKFKQNNYMAGQFVIDVPFQKQTTVSGFETIIDSLQVAQVFPAHLSGHSVTQFVQFASYLTLGNAPPTFKDAMTVMNTYFNPTNVETCLHDEDISERRRHTWGIHMPDVEAGAVSYPLQILNASSSYQKHPSIVPKFVTEEDLRYVVRAAGIGEVMPYRTMYISILAKIPSSYDSIVGKDGLIEPKFVDNVLICTKPIDLVLETEIDVVDVSIQLYNELEFLPKLKSQQSRMQELSTFDVAVIESPGGLTTEFDDGDNKYDAAGGHTDMTQFTQKLMSVVSIDSSRSAFSSAHLPFAASAATSGVVRHDNIVPQILWRSLVNMDTKEADVGLFKHTLDVLKRTVD